MTQVKFNPMKSKNFWDRPEFAYDDGRAKDPDDF